MKRDYLKYKDMSEIEQRLFSLRWYHTLKIGEDAFREMCLYLDSHRVNKYRFFELLEQVVYVSHAVKEELGWNAFIFGSHGIHNKQFNKDGSKKYTPWVEGMHHNQVTRYLHTMKKLGIIKLHKPGTNSKYHENKAAMYSWQGYGFFEKQKIELNENQSS